MSGFALRSFRLVLAPLLLALLAYGGACRKSDESKPSTDASSGGAASAENPNGTGKAAGGVSGTGGSSLAGGSMAGSTTGGTQGNPGDVDAGTAAPDAGVADLRPTDAYLAPDLSSGSDTTTRFDAPVPFWPDPFVADCTPPAINGRQQTDGHHHAGDDCMTSGCHLNPDLAAHYEGTDCRGSGCHINGSPDGSGAPAFLFGGTIYRALTFVAAPSQEVGVWSAEGFFSACSATNGNFWSLAPKRTSPPLTWSSAWTRVRNTEGESVMNTALTSGCNTALCHTGDQKLTSP